MNRFRRIVPFVVLCIAPILTPACGSSSSDVAPAPSTTSSSLPPSDTNDPGPPDASVDGAGPAPLTDPAAIAKACTDYATAYCAKFDSCDAIALTIAYGDVTTCVKRWTFQCPTNYFSVPGTSLTPARWEACAQAYSAASCVAFMSATPLPDCTNRPGTLPNGAACAYANQCLSTNCKGGANGCGTCAPLAPVGGDCQSSADCAGGATCAATGTCVAWGDVGAPCDTNHPCDPATLACVSGTCTPQQPYGGSCTAVEQCKWDADCANDHTCKQNSTTPSGSCGYNADSTFVFCAHGTCNNGVNNQGTCVSYAADDAPCDPSSSLYCMYPAQCLGGVCKVVDAMSCK